MSNYSKSVDFAAKDALPSGDSNKIVKGSEINAEFNAIQTASGTKLDKTGGTLTGLTTIQRDAGTGQGVLLKVTNTNNTSSSGAYIELEGGSHSINPKIGGFGNFFDVYVSNKRIALFGKGGTVTSSCLTMCTDNDGSTGGQIHTGANTPEGNISAPVGSLYMRTNGGAGTSLYVKESGTGNTGWVAK
jgi:hypothetical protein